MHQDVESLGDYLIKLEAHNKQQEQKLHHMEKEQTALGKYLKPPAKVTLGSVRGQGNMTSLLVFVHKIEKTYISETVIYVVLFEYKSYAISKIGNLGNC